MRKILVMEDEDNIRAFVVLNLKRVGYDVVDVASGEAALEAFAQAGGDFDIAILDIMLPGIDGFEVCRRIREQSSSIGIIMLSAKSQEMDKVQGLMLGADDYITKPFSVAEVLARVRANIRRVTQYAEPPEKSMVLTAGALRLDGKERTVTKAGERIELTAKEFDILKLLMANPKRVYTKAQLYTQVWNDAYCGDENAVSVHISRLRGKIEDDPRDPRYVATVWGIGYKLGEK